MAQAEQSAFTIISAAAGSGKTYTLVLQYLTDLLKTPQPERFKEMLAITFTNKAVYEMKHRIVSTLAQLAKTPGQCPMAPQLQKQLELSQENLQLRAEQTLKHLLQEYGAFDVITIDRFNHRIIRTFAFDLQLPYGFEVVVQNDEFLRTLVDRLIAKVGSDPALTKILVDFTLSKIDDQKSWDIGRDLLQSTAVLMNENDRIPLQALKSLTLENLRQLQKKLHTKVHEALSNCNLLGEQTLALLHTEGLTAQDFTRQTLYNHFTSLQQLDSSGIAEAYKMYNNQLAAQLEGEKPLYKAKTKSVKIEQIEALRPSLQQAYVKGKKLVFLAHQYRSLLQQLTPLSLLGKMEQELEVLQREQNKMLLARFNARIAEVVAQQPAPFIYERLGEKYRYYYIDEFQDTSVLQWHNLVPLVGNALDGLKDGSEAGAVFLVGDPKQAIYRWRGGDVQQFLNLLQKNSPFQQTPKVHELNSNYRSAADIVAFNNSLFAFLGGQLEDPQQQYLFQVTAQQQPEKESLQGGVQLEFITKHTKKEDRIPEYLSVLLGQLKTAAANGYSWCDMAILTRQKEEGQHIAAMLSEEEIPAISSEALLLSSSEKVTALVGLMELCIQPQDPLPRKAFFHVLWPVFGAHLPYYDFLRPLLHQPLKEAFKVFNATYDTNFVWEKFCSSSPYEAIEYCLASFDLPWHQDPYLQFFLDEVHQFVQSKENSFERFLHYWEHQKGQLSLQLSEGLDALQIMTIHKAKGLEFPVVFVPFLEQGFVGKSTKIWMALEEELHPLQWGQFNASKTLSNYPQQMATTYETAFRAAVFDAANVLYVACTRAVEQLYLTSTVDAATPTSNYAALLTQFAQTQGEEPQPNSMHQWGYLGPREAQQNHMVTAAAAVQFSLKANLNWQSRLIFQLPQNDSAAQHYGIVVHDILKHIRSKADVHAVLNQAERSGQLTHSERHRLEEALEVMLVHPDIAPAFDPTNAVWIEQEILLPGGEQVRPDRFAATSEGLLLIDFKTGQPQEAHQQQIQQYADALNFMPQAVTKKCLVYLNQGVSVLKVA